MQIFSAPLFSTRQALAPGLAAITLAGCTSMSADGGAGLAVGEGPARQRSERRIVLTDRRGERWDITHAVNVYGMKQAWWEFGIGKHAIPPLDHPRQIPAGDPRYPSPYLRGMQVIGTLLGDGARSYPRDRLTRHEIVNETFGNLQAAVAY